MAIYTRRGDKGKTTLYGGITEISKSDPRIKSCGTIDELSSQLGLVSSLLTDRKLKRVIHSLQQDLFEIGSEIATPEGLVSPFKLAKRKITKLERIIDGYWGKLPTLSQFVFPGGTPAAASLHVARSVARRAEREVVAADVINPNIIPYLNRLSDLLFTLARWVNFQAGVSEKTWPGIKKKVPK